MAKTSAPEKAQLIKAYSYLRFSTPAQGDGHSKRRQSELAENYARLHGLALDTELTFHDLGVSAYRNANVVAGRLGDFKKAVEIGLVPQGSFLLVESLDRISRTTVGRATRILMDICDAGITVVTLSDNHSYTAESLAADQMSFMWAAMVFMRASEESAIKGQRLRAAWQRKREVAHEMPYTSLCPGWLSLDKATMKFVVNEERAEIVRRIFGETLQGVSPHSLALGFNVEGVQPFGRGKEWHRSYIVKLLDSPAVIGELHPHTIDYSSGKRKRIPQPVVPNYFPAIISTETFARVKAMRGGAISPRRGMHSTSEVSNIFGGLGICSECGGTVTRVNKGRGLKQWHYLLCRSGKNGNGCRSKVVPYAQIEGAVLNNVDWLLDNVPSNNRAKARALDTQIRQAQANLEACDDGLANLLEIAKTAPSASLTRNIRDVVAEQAELSATLADLSEQRALTSGALVRSKLKDLQAVLSEEVLNRTKLNAILRQLLTSVELNAEEGRITLNWKHGGFTAITFRDTAEDFGFTRGSQLVAPKRPTRVTKGSKRLPTRETK